MSMVLFIGLEPNSPISYAEINLADPLVIEDCCSTLDLRFKS
jgi:hypothetical protein